MRWPPRRAQASSRSLPEAGGRHDDPQASFASTSHLLSAGLVSAGLVGLAIFVSALCLMNPPLASPSYWLHGFPPLALNLLAPAIFMIATLLFIARLRAYRRLVARLSGSEARYRLLAEGSGDVVLLVDGEGICRTVAPSVRGLIDRPPEMVIDRAVREHVHPEDFAAVREAGRAARSEAGRSSSLVFRVRHRSGDWIWCETRMRAQPDGTLVCAVRDISEQHAREAMQVHSASIDSLTGLLNRDSLKRSLAGAIRLANRERQSLALILFDIDHFKKINDAHGHPTGDLVLQAIGDACGQAVRTSDHAGRIGGEEFALVLPGATIAAATDVCTRLRQCIESAPVLDARGRPIVVTISAGIAVLGATMADDDLIDAADRALYAAKNAGRDCVFALIGEQFIRAL